MDKKRVLILGGGYLGTQVVKSLSQCEEVEVTLVDKNGYHLLQPELHYFLASVKTEEQVLRHLSVFCDKYNATFIQDEFINVDTEAKKATFKSQELAYDYLVIGIGSQGFVPPQIKGGDTFVKDIKKIEDARYIRAEFERLLKENRDINIAVAGGGLSGVEIVTEMACTAQNAGRQNIKFTIIEGMDSILPMGIDKKLIVATQKRLDDLGIHCQYGEFISEITEDKIFVGENRKIEIKYDLLCFVTGIISSCELDNFQDNGQIDLNKKRQLITDEYLRIKGHEVIFAGGDNAQVKDDDDNFLPPSGQVALMNGVDIADNIVRSIENKPLKPYNSKMKGVLISLGEEFALGEVFGLRVKKVMAYILKFYSLWSHRKKF